MLVLSRKKLDEICIGENIVIRVLRVSGDRVKIGIEAPDDTPIWRGEIHDERLRERSEYRGPKP